MNTKIGIEASKKLKQAVNILVNNQDAVAGLLAEAIVYDQIYDFSAAGILYSAQSSQDGHVHSYTWEYLVQNSLEDVCVEIKQNIFESIEAGDLVFPN